MCCFCAKATELAKAEAEKNAAEQKAKDDKPIGAVASLAPDQSTPKADAPVAVADIPRALQIELRRVGCNTGAADGNWNAAAQRSLVLFNKNAKTKFDVKLASLDALDAVKGKQGRVCPLICEHGYKPDGEKCSRIVCKAGFEVGDDNTCERVNEKKPTVPVTKRVEPTKPANAVQAKSEATGQIFCNSGGCRPVAKGCKIVTGISAVAGGGTSQREVCN